jgi:hypothetical protein
MREGSYALIDPGMEVLGSDEAVLGSVTEVLVDEGSNIFVGLVVRPGLFAHTLFVPGERLDRVHEGKVYANVAAGELEPYLSPEERRARKE